MVRFLVAILVATISTSSYAMDRRDYVREAAGEMDFYLRFLAAESRFTKNLTAEELTQFEGIKKISAELKILNPEIKIHFSQNAADFQLSPGEPVRSAKTTERLEDPIWFNQIILNDEEQTILYLDIVQIFIHELGHKLGGNKNQSAVDSLSAKVQGYLKRYSRKDHVYVQFQEGPREWPEHFESLLLPKSLREYNPDPTTFFVDKDGPKKIQYYFKDLNLPPNEDRILQIDSLASEHSTNYYLEAKYSIFRSFQGDDGTLLVHENSYVMEDFFMVRNEFGFGGIVDQPFRVAKRIWQYRNTNFQFQVQSITEVQRSASEIQWDVVFTGKTKSKNIHLLLGADSLDTPYPCKLIKEDENSSTARCTYPIPKVTCISIIHVNGLLIDGDVAALPVKIDIDLEMKFNLQFVFSDQKVESHRNFERDGKTRYEIVMTTPDGYTNALLRCREKRDFTYKGKVLGQTEKIVEQIYDVDNLPMTSTKKDTFIFQFTCDSAHAIADSVVLTDGSGYPRYLYW